MSEKLKGIFGSKERANEVLQWLIAQGAEPASVKLLGGDTCNTIYYVNKQKQAMWVNAIHSELFDIVELPRWRAEIGGRFYFINYIGKVDFDTDLRGYADNSAYEIGNYFQTKEEAEKYTEKFYEIFKEIKNK